MSLDPYKLPMDRTYRLRMTGCNTHFPGAKFVDGVTVEPVKWRDARRIAFAWGVRSCTIEYWDEPTLPEPEPTPPEPEPVAELTLQDEGDDIRSMSRPALHALAEDMGIEIPSRTSTRRLRELIRDARLSD